MYKKSIAALLVVTVALSVFGISVHASTIDVGSAVTRSTPAYVTPDVAPLNPEFLKYRQDQTAGSVFGQTEDRNVLGYTPAPVDLSPLTQQTISYPQASYPASYDLRAQGKVTPVKDQGICNGCWAFGTYASLESYLRPSETRDFSENNMKNTHGFDPLPCYGGNIFMSTAYLSRWSGPVDEASDPYNPSLGTSPSNLPVQKHVQEVLFLPDKTNLLDYRDIKMALTMYGVLASTIYWDSAYYNALSHTYYYGGSSASNHVIAIVGWDDNFDKSHFSGASGVPPGNGAFIVKNSWGTDWGANGYFYISYYDSLIGTYNSVFTAEPTTNYDHVYQYDSLGWTRSYGMGSDAAWFANIFTATSNEQLSAVSFYTHSYNSQYDIYVYTNPVSGPMSSSSTAENAGTITFPGYHTIPLNTGVPLSPGEKFSVVVKLTTPGYNYPVPIEEPIPGYSNKAIAYSGESFVSVDGTSWSDITQQYSNTNVCLKAFTKDTGSTPTLTANIKVATVSRILGHPQYLQMTVMNTGSSNAAVAPWVSLYGGAPTFTNYGIQKFRWRYDHTTLHNTVPYAGLNWGSVAAGEQTTFYTDAVITPGMAWAMSNAWLFDYGSNQFVQITPVNQVWQI